MQLGKQLLPIPFSYTELVKIVKIVKMKMSFLLPGFSFLEGVVGGGYTGVPLH